MSQRNVELTQRYYDAWNSGEIDSVVAALSPAVEWRGHPRLPEPGPYRGRAAVEQWMGQFREAWGALVARPVDLIDAGDSVAVLVHMSGEGRESGVPVRGGVDVHVLAFDDDGVAFFRIYPADDAAEAAGLSRDEMDALALRVKEGMDGAESARRMGIDQADFTALRDGAFEKLRGFAANRSGTVS